VSTEDLINELGQSQALLVALAEDVDEKTFRSQYHPDLSPLGWHLGHCVYTECLWLHETLRGDGSVTEPIADLYTPPHTPKNERGKLLPPRQALLEWARELQAFNLHYLHNLRPQWRNHALLEDNYLIHFLIQHNSQHYETMLMVLTQKALKEHQPDAGSHRTLQAAELKTELINIPAGHYRIGGCRPVAYDNEIPPQRAELGAYAISRTPVSNAEYLAFIEDAGYQRREFWQDGGWSWREENGTGSPDHWRKTDTGDWCAIGMNGSYNLAGSEPVSGINYYEASAFALWAKARLPHEYQWEAACRIGLLEQTGRVWEWCNNSFHPYQGFTAFPYPEYSQSWLDGKHFSLRGGSLYTRPAIKRPSFRNFYLADKRHIFAGLRLVY